MCSNPLEPLPLTRWGAPTMQKSFEIWLPWFVKGPSKKVVGNLCFKDVFFKKHSLKNVTGFVWWRNDRYRQNLPTWCTEDWFRLESRLQPYFHSGMRLNTETPLYIPGVVYVNLYIYINIDGKSTCRLWVNLCYLFPKPAATLMLQSRSVVDMIWQSKFFEQQASYVLYLRRAWQLSMCSFS